MGNDVRKRPMFSPKPIYLDPALSKGGFMNSGFMKRTTPISLLAALLIPIQLVAQDQTNYVVTNLGTLGGER